MKAIINCGGKGTRLPSVSEYLPKPMVEINGKPLLFWLIQNLKRQGIHDIIITLHHLAEKITTYFGDGKEFGISLSYSYEEKLLGTGGAIIPIKNFIQEETLLLYGDVLLKVDFKKMLAFHKRHNAIVTAAIHPSFHPEDSDLVEFDRFYRLQKILKKPHATVPKNPYSLSALYIFSPQITPFLSLTPPFDIAHDLLPSMLKKDAAIICYNTDEFIMDIGTPERLEKAMHLKI